jgi:hypothetical protein
MLTTILSLLGGGLGGLLRFVPEILEFFKNRQDGDQKFRMAQLQLDVDKARSVQALALNQAQSDSALALTRVQIEGAQVVADAQSLDAAVKMQGQLTGVHWVDAVNSTVRPFITYWWMILFTVYKVGFILKVWQDRQDLSSFMLGIWTSNDWGILSMILGFWFVDRAIRKNNGQ